MPAADLLGEEDDALIRMQLARWKHQIKEFEDLLGGCTDTETEIEDLLRDCRNPNEAGKSELETCQEALIRSRIKAEGRRGFERKMTQKDRQLELLELRHELATVTSEIPGSETGGKPQRGAAFGEGIRRPSVFGVGSSLGIARPPEEVLEEVKRTSRLGPAPPGAKKSGPLRSSRKWGDNSHSGDAAGKEGKASRPSTGTLSSAMETRDSTLAVPDVSGSGRARQSASSEGVSAGRLGGNQLPGLMGASLGQIKEDRGGGGGRAGSKSGGRTAKTGELPSPMSPRSAAGRGEASPTSAASKMRAAGRQVASNLPEGDGSPDSPRLGAFAKAASAMTPRKKPPTKGL